MIISMELLMKWLGVSDLMILLLQFWFLDYFDEMFGVVMALCWLGFCELQVPTDAYEPEVRNFKKGFVSENSCCLNLVHHHISAG
jgi:hypothetical protein